jgi:lysosomal Pro-X carboxypeptidase
MRCAAVVAVVLLATTAAAVAPRRGMAHTHGAVPLSHAQKLQHPGTANCDERFYEQKLNHFGFAPKPAEAGKNASVGYSFMQRYFVCRVGAAPWKAGAPIFYYTGNEANVELFVNASGLMWENAVHFGAILVFAEHRFFGKSLPYPGEDMPAAGKLTYLTVDQALADYAEHINFLREEWQAPGSAVIGFGGSYGGMLCSWLRFKYPSALDGCIAGSAPIVNFEDMAPKYDYDGFATIETLDASAAGGAEPMCKDNMRAAFHDIVELAKTAGGRTELQQVLQLCKPLAGDAGVGAHINNFYANAIGDMSMSSYPYPSSYLLLGGAGILPAYPMRVACSHLGANFTDKHDRLAAMAKAMFVYLNATGTAKCANLEGTVNHASEVVGYLWDYLSCTTMFMPMSTNGKSDMFWNAPWSTPAQIAYCQQQWDVTPQPDWVKVQYGGWAVARTGSNTVFSNGQLDPWRPGGIQSATAPTIATVIIAECGHHIDLMFADPKDTPAIKAAREMEMRHVTAWIAGKTKQ